MSVLNGIAHGYDEDNDRLRLLREEEETSGWAAFQAVIYIIGWFVGVTAYICSSIKFYKKVRQAATEFFNLEN